MEQDSLVKFIKEKLDEGVEKGKLRELLFETGFLPSEIEKAFEETERLEIYPIEGRTEETTGQESNPIYQSPFQEKKKIPFKLPKISLKKLKPFLIALLLILLCACAFYVFAKTMRVDPVSLLPEETSFYLRIRINSKDNQVKNFKGLLKKFPNYEKISENIQKELEKIKEENPIFTNVDLTNIGNELVLGFISPINPAEFQESHLILILSQPDLKKNKKIVEDVKESIKQEEGWEIQEESYKQGQIIKLMSRQKYETDLFFTFTNNNVVLTHNLEDIKKVIDVLESQKIQNIFKRAKAKNITQTKNHRKIQKYLTKDYLLLFYSEGNLSELLKTVQETEMTESTKSTYFLFEPFLRAGFVQAQGINQKEKTVLASAISVDKNGFKIETHHLNSGEVVSFNPQFSLKETLANFVPAKIGLKDIVFYEEGKNLLGLFEGFEKDMEAQVNPQAEKWLLEEKLKEFNEMLDIDLKKDILPLLTNNYVFLVAGETEGREVPFVGLIFEIEDENQAINQVLKIRLPNEMVGLSLKENISSSRLKAKDARAAADMMQLHITGEFFYETWKSYWNFTCNHKDIKNICADILEQTGAQPVIRRSASQYCGYIKLNEPEAYYCIDSRGGDIKTYIKPFQREYCAGNTFICPPQGSLPVEVIPGAERTGFTLNIIDGFEVYSLPVLENFGLNFSTKDNKLIFAFTPEGVVDVLKSLDAGTQKLKDSELFSGQFQKIPQNISGLYYFEPYGLIGLVKYGINFYANVIDEFFFDIMEEEKTEAPETSFSATLLPQALEFLDKGIAPYLKMLKAASSYSFSPENGLVISKGRLDIEELNIWEKQTVEEFWLNIDTWLEENFVPLIEMFNPTFY